MATHDGLASIQERYAGMWVAVKDDQVVEVRQSPHALVLALRERHIEDATILRCPNEHEAELVGLG